MIRAGERFVNTQQLAHIRECFRLEITALIAMNAVRHSKSADPVPHKHLCRGCGTLVGHCKHLSPVSKTALNCSNVAVSSPRPWQGSNSVNMDVLRGVARGK